MMASALPTMKVKSSGICRGVATETKRKQHRGVGACRAHARSEALLSAAGAAAAATLLVAGPSIAKTEEVDAYQEYLSKTGKVSVSEFSAKKSKSKPAPASPSAPKAADVKVAEPQPPAEVS